MRQENKTKSVKRFSVKMLLAMVFGGVLGGLFGIFMYYFHGNLEVFLTTWPKVIQSILAPGMLVVDVISVLAGEICLRKLGKVCERIENAEDEEADLVSYQEEKYGAILQCVNVISQVFCIFLLANGYQMGYIESSNKNATNFLIACILFIACFFYDGIVQARYIKLLQKVHPEKRGDVSSIKFQQQWLESCDEAEKEVIYQSSYKTYVFMNRAIGLLLIITMVSHLFFKTGIMAILVVGVMYLILVMKYSFSCVSLRKNRILR